MPNKTLTAKVKIDTTSASRSLDRLAKKINQFETLINKNANGSGLEKQLKKAVTQQNKLKDATSRTDSIHARIISKVKTITGQARGWLSVQKGIHSTARSTNSVFTSMYRTIRNLASAYLGIMGIRATADTSDIITSAENRLNNLAGGNSKQTAETMDKVYAASQRARTGYTDMMANVSKTMTLAGDAFGGSIDNAIRFQEIMSKSYTIGGASAAEQASSMYQLVQALGSGILQGDELRSVREGAPIAYKEIEKFAQGVLNTEESLKELASQGKITSEMVVAAIMNAEDKIEESFKNTKMTFAQAFTNIKNVAVKAFEPVLQKMNDALNSPKGIQTIHDIGNALIWLADKTEGLIDALGTAFNWIKDNWETVKNVLVAGVMAWIGVMIYQAGVAVISFAATLMAMTPIQWTAIILIAAVMGLIYTFYLFKTGAVDACQAITIALLIVAAAVALIGLIFGNVYVVAAGAIIAILALAFMFFEEICGIVWSILMFAAGVVQLIFNVVATLFVLCGAAFYNFVALIINLAMGIVQTVVSACGWIEVAWNNMCNNLAVAFWNVIASVAEGLNKILAPINQVLEKAGKSPIKINVENIRNKANAAKSNITENSSLGSALASGWKNGFNTLDRISYGSVIQDGMKTFDFGLPEDWEAAYNQGASWGAGIKDSINKWGSQFQNKETDTSKLLGLDDQYAAQLAMSNGLPSAYDPSLALDPYNAGDLLDGIKGDTGSIKDSMDLTQEDLEYLRRIADMEWKKEYTTANIVVDMQNTNTINNKGDLENWVESLRDMLAEELDYVANGVYQS